MSERALGGGTFEGDETVFEARPNANPSDQVPNHRGLIRWREGIWSRETIYIISLRSHSQLPSQSCNFVFHHSLIRPLYHVAPAPSLFAASAVNLFKHLTSLFIPTSFTMAPGLVEDLPVSSSNGKGATAEHAADPAAATKGKYNAIPGPLGLASASLEGKVALVTGAGKHFLYYLFSSEFFLGWISGTRPFGASDIPGTLCPVLRSGMSNLCPAFLEHPTSRFGLRVGKSASAPVIAVIGAETPGRSPKQSQGFFS